MHFTERPLAELYNDNRSTVVEAANTEDDVSVPADNVQRTSVEDPSTENHLHAGSAWTENHLNAGSFVHREPPARWVCVD